MMGEKKRSGEGWTVKYAVAVINVEGKIICLCAARVQTDGCRASGCNFRLHSVGVIML